VKKCQEQIKQKGRSDVQGVEPQRGESLIAVINAGKNSVLNARGVGLHGAICMSIHIALPVEQKQDRRRWHADYEYPAFFVEKSRIEENSAQIMVTGE